MQKIFSAVLIITLLCSCSSYKPILDQNAKFFATNEDEQESDIKQCTKNADDYLQKYKAERMRKEAGRKAVIGAVVGAASGLIFGHDLKGLLTGSVVGAGVGASVGALSVAGEDKVNPDHIKQNYVSNCLARKGYSVIGWR